MMPKNRFQLLICVMFQLLGRKHLRLSPDLDNGGFYYSPCNFYVHHVWIIRGFYESFSSRSILPGALRKTEGFHLLQVVAQDICELNITLKV